MNFIAIFSIIIVLYGAYHFVSTHANNYYSVLILGLALVYAVTWILYIIKGIFIARIIGAIAVDLLIGIVILEGSDENRSNLPIIVFMVSFVLIQMVAFRFNISYLQVVSKGVAFASIFGEIVTFAISIALWKVSCMIVD